MSEKPLLDLERLARKLATLPQEAVSNESGRWARDRRYIFRLPQGEKVELYAYASDVKEVTLWNSPREGGTEIMRLRDADLGFSKRRLSGAELNAFNELLKTVKERELEQSHREYVLQSENAAVVAKAWLGGLETENILAYIDSRPLDEWRLDSVQRGNALNTLLKGTSLPFPAGTVGINYCVTPKRFAKMLNRLPEYHCTHLGVRVDDSTPVYSEKRHRNKRFFSEHLDGLAQRIDTHEPPPPQAKGYERITRWAENG